MDRPYYHHDNQNYQPTQYAPQPAPQHQQYLQHQERLRQQDYRASSSYYQQEQEQYSYHAPPRHGHSSSTNDLPPFYRNRRWLHALEFLTRPTSAIVVAIVVVIVFHYQEDLWHWWYSYFPPHVPWHESLQALFYQTCDWWRGAWQRSREAVRSWGDYNPMRQPTAAPTNNINNGNNNNKSNNGSRQRNNNNRRQNLSMPELENVNEPTEQRSAGKKKKKRKKAKHGQQQQQSSSSQQQQTNATPKRISKQRDPRARNRAPLQPAFPTDQDFPTGWMVYHGELGVVSKQRADEYEQEQERLQQQEQQQEQLLEGESKTTNGESRISAKNDENVADNISSSCNTNGKKKKKRNKKKSNGGNAGEQQQPQPQQPQQQQQTMPVLPSIAANG